jgi:hypothetical protein
MDYRQFVHAVIGLVNDSRTLGQELHEQLQTSHFLPDVDQGLLASYKKARKRVRHNTNDHKRGSHVGASLPRNCQEWLDTLTQLLDRPTMASITRESIAEMRWLTQRLTELLQAHAQHVPQEESHTIPTSASPLPAGPSPTCLVLPAQQASEFGPPPVDDQLRRQLRQFCDLSADYAFDPRPAAISAYGKLLVRARDAVKSSLESASGEAGTDELARAANTWSRVAHLLAFEARRQRSVCFPAALRLATKLDEAFQAAHLRRHDSQ